MRRRARVNFSRFRGLSSKRPPDGPDNLTAASDPRSACEKTSEWHQNYTS